MRKKIDISKFLKRGILILLLVGIGSIFILDRYAKSLGYKGIKDFYTIYSTNSAKAESANPVVMNIDMSDSDYAFLEANRQKALDRGVQINVGDNYVKCEIEAEGEKIDAEIRLKGHMTDHLEGEKWSFRVKAKESILGMYRFSLQRPATRNFIYEWIYHQLLKQEGIIHLNYDFIHLNLKDKDLGIYAIEEHFGQHVLEHNNRPKGAILRWNPGLYWEHRIDNLQGIYLDEQYAAFTSSYAEPYDKGTIKSDPELVETYKKGAALLEAFRRGDSLASAVFDVPLMARFHAIIDVIGGYHSLDWSDIKFFYNSETGRVEPVGYESFSVVPSTDIAGQRIPADYHDVKLDYHNQLFSDPIFFAAYIQELERIASETYFSDFLASIEKEKEEKLAIIALEWPHREFSLDTYFENIDKIQHNLELPKPFHAFLDEKSDTAKLVLSISPVSDFPLEMVSVEIDGDEFPTPEFVLPPKARDTYAHYFEITIPHTNAKLKNIILRSRIPGSSHIFETEVIEFPAYESEVETEFTVSNLKTIDFHPDAVYNSTDSVFYFDAMDITIDANYMLYNSTLRLLPGQNITFVDGSLILQQSNIESFGATDNEVTLRAEQEEVLIRSNKGDLTFYNTQFDGVNKAAIVRDAEVQLENCSIAEVGGSFIDGLHSEITYNSCYLGTIASLGNYDRCHVSLKEVVANHGERLLNSYGSQVRIHSSTFNDFEQLLTLSHLSVCKMWSSKLSGSGKIADLNNSSEYHAITCDMGDVDHGFTLDAEGVNLKPSVFTFYKSNQKGIKTLSN